MNPHTDMHIAEIRELAQRFSASQIEDCIQQALEQGDNPCYENPEVVAVMQVLAKAEFVKAQMEKGATLQEAMRELGRRIRAVQGGAR